MNLNFINLKFVQNVFALKLITDTHSPILRIEVQHERSLYPMLLGTLSTKLQIDNFQGAEYSLPSLLGRGWGVVVVGVEAWGFHAFS